MAAVNKSDHYPEKINTIMKKTQEKRKTWYELRFVFQKFEALITGSLSDTIEETKLEAFLGAVISPKMTNGSNFFLFSSIITVETTPCSRMLRNYQKKKAIVNPWCVTSSLFNRMKFSTSPLEFHQSEPVV